jgi:hypothetical protein
MNPAVGECEVRHGPTGCGRLPPVAAASLVP